MGLGRGGDDQRVGRRQHSLEPHLLGARLPAERLGAFEVRIVDSGQPCAGGRGDLQRMVAAEMAGARDANPKL